MKVFLGNPPWREGDKYGIRAGSRWPHFAFLPEGSKYPDYMPFPFFLAYAAAVLEADGFEVMLIDSIAERTSDEDFIKRVGDFDPDLYITETSTPSFGFDLDFSKRVRDVSPRALIGLAGPHVSTMGSEVIERYPWVDIVLKGEYEYSLLDVARSVRDGKFRSRVSGAIIRAKDGSIIEGGQRDLVENIDSFPWPARKFLPMLNYNDAFCGLPRPNLQMWASRGCPFTCVFCLWPQVMYGGTRYRARDPVNVVDEMQRVSAEYGMKSVYFDDDTFDIGKSRMLKLAAEIKSRNMGLPWAVMARADTIDAESLEAMRDAGLFAIKYGVESSDEHILASSGKGLDLKKLENTVAITRSLGIKFHLTFSFGLPGETWDTVRKTVDYALELEPDSAQFSIVTPFPGTKHYQWAKERGYLLTEDWSLYNGAGRAVVRTEAMSGKDLEDALCYAWDQWRAHHAAKTAFADFGRNSLDYIVKSLKDPGKAVKYAKLKLDQMRRSKRREGKR